MYNQKIENKTRETGKLLELRRNLKARTPRFIRQDADKKITLGFKWRKPKGVHSKLRHKFKGHGKMVEVGYGSPAEVKWLSKEGLKQILVRNEKEAEKINHSEEGAVIANVGIKNRISIVRKCIERKIKILNMKDPQKWLAETEKMIAEKITEKAKKQSEKKEKNKEKEKKAEEQSKKKTIEKTIEGEEKKDIEKKEVEKREAEKIITKKEV